MGVGIALGGWPGVVFTKGGIHSPYEQKTPYRQEKKEIEPFSELSLYVGSEADVVVMASKMRNIMSNIHLTEITVNLNVN